MTDTSSSVVTSPPDDDSGRQARRGFDFQDLCALRYCLDSAINSSWDEVWCESHEDIVLYRKASSEIYRFVQVKYKIEAAKHWSQADLCKFEKADLPNGSKKQPKTIDDTILCKLFSKDKYSGESDFRLAINEGVDKELKPFSYRWGKPAPNVKHDCVEAVALMRRIEEWTPPPGRALWDYISRLRVEMHSVDTEEMENLVAQELRRFLYLHHSELALDEEELLFRYLYSKVHKAASISLKNSGSAEKITIKSFREDALTRAGKVQTYTEHISVQAPSDILKSRLTELGLNDSFIENACDLRRNYYAKWRSSTGTEYGGKMEMAMDEIRSIVNEESLKRLDNEPISNAKFLLLILERVRAVHSSAGYGQHNISVGLMHGMCYFLMGRGRLGLNS